ncbi:MAG TPA: hypothetical protein VNG12_04750 [Acidimicrobiales bacterium]|nr:hypothetical protein [Acidimicrobiales bacterium]
MAMSKSLDAAAHQITLEDAEADVRELSLRHPEDVRLVVIAANLMAQRGSTQEAIEELRDLRGRVPDSRTVQLALANLLVRDESSYREAIQLYQSAAETGPRLDPCHRTRAFHAARTVGSELATRLLRDATPLERAAVLTRELGPWVPVVAVVALVVGAVATWIARLFMLSLVLAAVGVSSRVGK